MEQLRIVCNVEAEAQRSCRRWQRRCGDLARVENEINVMDQDRPDHRRAKAIAATYSGGCLMPDK
eukprot:16128794-Heterocapsa_arctica.AAC.1